MKISIIIPVYNTEKYISSCIESCINQTEKNIEVLLIDDGSSDHSGIICDKYSKKDKRIRVYHIKNQGVSYARNIGIEKATGEWILFVDSDDYIAENLCEEVILCIKNHPDTEIIFFNFSFVKKDSIIVQHTKTAEEEYKVSLEDLIHYRFRGGAEEKLNVTTSGFPWGKAIMRDTLKNNNITFLQGVQNLEDSLFCISLYTKAGSKTAVCINKALYFWRIRQDSLSNKINKNRYENDKRIFKEYRKILNLNDSYLYDSLAIYSFRCMLSVIKSDCFERKYTEKNGVRETLNSHLNSDIYFGWKSSYKKYFNKKQNIILWLARNKMYFILFFVCKLKRGSL